VHLRTALSKSGIVGKSVVILGKNRSMRYGRRRRLGDVYQLMRRMMLSRLNLSYLHHLQVPSNWMRR
jgi:hypothetical protein